MCKPGETQKSRKKKGETTALMQAQQQYMYVSINDAITREKKNDRETERKSELLNNEISRLKVEHGVYRVIY